jgi:flagellar hook-associated protein 1 FlgK
MATGIITETNNLHVLGFGLDGNNNRKFFDDSAVPSSLLNPTSRNMSFHINMYVLGTNTIDAQNIAAADVNEYGDNKNAKLIADLITDGALKHLGETYASLIYTVGADQRDAKTTGDNQQSVLNQLMSQRNAESGVSLNEEAINLIKFQRAYQASSRFVTVLNSLSAEILNFVGV